VDLAPPPPPPPAPAAPEDDWSDVDLAAPAPAAPPARAPEPLLDFEPEPMAAEPPPSAPAPIEISEEPGPELELAPLHEFVPAQATTGHQAAAVVAPPTAFVAAAAAAPAVAQGGTGFTPGRAEGAGQPDGGEAVLRQALSQASREVIERVVWEVVPQLAETIIRENLDRLVKARQG
jgi:hypothetical protein